MTLSETIDSQGFQVFEVFLAYRFPVLAQSSRPWRKTIRLSLFKSNGA